MLTCNSFIGVKGEISINPSETNAVSESALEKMVAKNLSLEDSSYLKDEKQNTAPETKSEAIIDTEFTSKPVENNEFVEGDLEEFAERLGINEYTKNKDQWKKFYDFAGSEFVWLPAMRAGERREVYDYVVGSHWEPIGVELAKNTLEYRRLLESKTLDASQGSHILLRGGKLIKYGNEITSEEDEELGEKYPGCFYVPVVEYTAIIRKVSAFNDDKRKEWQKTIHIS
ncbi:hypothetical protein C1645_768536 [Glomus cerebriforme]|uniref:Uncharacterized protein n=1 Tax=Glomus cerebriforme TaxID=658196 RepID=A0A397T4F8_9GLOM|nr:hypothetical protein C1645_768536 [Glomus cerebriforme]